MEFKYIITGVVVLIVISLVLKGKGSVVNTPPQGTSDKDIRDLALQGKKIQAVKWYRAIHGVGLKEAKDAVEQML